jgi:hypothetical protein
MFENTSAAPDTIEKRAAELNELLASMKNMPVEQLSSAKAFVESVGGIVEGQ